MNDLASAPTISDSTALDPGAAAPAAAGGGVPNSLGEPAEPSMADTIAAAVKKATIAEAEPAKDEPEKAAEKPAKDDKPPEAKEAAKAPERRPNGQFEGKEKPAGEAAEADAAQADAKPAETNGNGRHIEPPAKFLPDAKETWRNTPRAVQRDIDNAVREHEAEVTKYREAAERYEPIRRYDDYVRQQGRAGVHETLAEVAELEDLMTANPLAGLNKVLMRVGPKKADGQPYSMYEVAQSIVQMGPEGYQKAVAQRQQNPANSNTDPRIEQLQGQIAAMQQQQVAQSVIEPFKATHPRYAELENDIAFFLKSGKVPGSLSPQDRLAAAYDMAVRINPASHDGPRAQADPDPGDRAGESFSGSTSIKSTPGAVTPNDEPDRGGSIEEVLQRAVRAQKLR